MSKLTLPDITITNGQTESAVLDMKAIPYKFLRNLLVVGPAVMAEAIKIYVAKSPTGTFVPLQSGGADVSLTAAKGTPVTSIMFGALKFVAASAVTGDKVIEMSGAEENTVLG